MIRCYFLDGEAGNIELENLERVVASISENSARLAEVPLKAIIDLLGQLGKSMIRSDSLATVEGASYISLWLRKDNLERICRLNFVDSSYLDQFRDTGNGFLMAAQPRGVVCHWVASNVPTLSFFSLVMGILTKNGNILKVSEENRDSLIVLLEALSDLKTDVDGEQYVGRDISRAISVISFDSKETRHGEDFSKIADCKVVWGGADSVKAISAMPQKETCEVVTFGPKYTFGVFDRESIESDEFRSNLRKVLRDTLIFNQMACSSPQTLFFEKSDVPLSEIAEVMREEFSKLPKKLLGRPIPQQIAARIINARWTYLLSDDKEIVESKGLDWTILMNKNDGLEEPIHGGCIFIKEIGSLEDIHPHVTRKIQAIILCTMDDRKRDAFARIATRRGADRIVLPGTAHDFTLPWDGIMALNRLVRWAILYSTSIRGGQDVTG